jgi:hypothetical protein
LTRCCCYRLVGALAVVGLFACALGWGRLATSECRGEACCHHKQCDDDANNRDHPVGAGWAAPHYDDCLCVTVVSIHQQRTYGMIGNDHTLDAAMQNGCCDAKWLPIQSSKIIVLTSLYVLGWVRRCLLRVGTSRKAIVA